MKGFPSVDVLIVGNLHAHAVERIREEFSASRITTADARELTDDMLKSVRAVALGLGGKTGRADATFLGAFSRLEVVSNFGVGYDGVDAEFAAKSGIVVANTPDVLTDEVADTAVGLLIGTVRELGQAEQWLRSGRWEIDGPYPLTEGTLRGRSIGIFGLGRIGRAIARRVQAFELPISYYNRRQAHDVPYSYCPSLLDLASSVDTLIAVAPGDASTRGAIGPEVLRRLGKTGVLISIGRGSVVDEDALVEALKNRTILAAGLDVYATEPRVPAELMSCSNATLLPHVGSASITTRQAMADLVVDNLLAWFRTGRPLTPVAETAHLCP